MYSLFFIILWYILGCLGFIYWWTSEHNLTNAQIPVMLGVGLLGPFTFILGFLIHGNHDTITILKKRN